MTRFTFLALYVLTATALYSQSRLVGGPCEGCEAVFEFGDRKLTPVDTLADFENAGPKMIVTGTIYQPDGQTPAESVILYLYHTNREGVYPTRGDETGWSRRHGYLRGWIKTDSTGSYAFYTSRPGSYNSNPAHIHPTILEPDGRYYYINTYRFKGDPYLDPNETRPNRGGSGIVELKRQGDVLVAKRDIILGKNVPGYQQDD